MNKRILKNGLTGLLCIVLLLTNILSVGMEVTATELNSSILDAVENLNDDNNEDTEEIIENDGQEEDSNLEESDDSGFQNDDNNQENSDSGNENRDEEIENKENEEIDNSEEESEEIENDIGETLDEDDEILEENNELKEEAEIATVATEEETLSEISGQCGDNLTWVLEDGTLTISGTGDMWDDSSPWRDWLSDKPTILILEEGITKIGRYTFENYNFVGDLIIPNSVTCIEDCAFQNCNGFTGNLIIGDGVTSIGEYAFSHCSGFAGDLIIPDSVTSIGNSAFNTCSGFTGDLIIPDSVTCIEGWAFDHCNGFTGNLIIGNGVTSIGECAFYACNGFTGDLEIGNKVTDIEKLAFAFCSGFTGDLIIPDSVIDIGQSSFTGCSGFTGDLKIGNGATNIGEHAFRDCSGLAGSLVIGNGVKQIGHEAFLGCSSFSGDLIIGNSIEEIKTNIYGEFYGLDGFKSFEGMLKIGDGIQTIPDHIFEECNFKGNLVLGNGVAQIGESAFRGCSGFTGSLIMPNSVTNIGKNAFSDCGFTGELILSNSITSVEDDTFNGCNGFIGNLLIPNNVKSIGKNAFSNCGFTGQLIIPNSVTNIGTGAFSSCSGFTGNLIIPESISTIEADVFKECSGFTGSLIIPDCIMSIGKNAFYGCSGFSGNLVISNSVNKIQDGVFANCSGFKDNLVIPDTVTSIGENAFSGCNRFTGSLVIPDNVTYIGSGAFSDCNGFMGNLIIPDNVNNIRKNAFSGCNSLNNVIFEGNSPSVESETFNGITVKAYYPLWKSGWDSVVGNNYEGILTWIPYSEGTSPWENESTEGTTNFWFVVNTDAPDLDYDDVTGYNKKQLNLNVSLTHLGMEIDPESYEDVNLAIELPEGLSFSQNEEVKTLTDSLGTIDKTNNKQDVSHLVYITGNNKVDKFTVTVKVTAKDYVTPQVHTYDIGINTGETDPNATYFSGTLEAVDILGFNVTIDGKVYYVTDSFNMRIPMDILQNDDKRVICTVSGEKISKMETIENAAELEIILLGGKGDIIYQNGGYTSNSKTIQIVLHFNIKDKYKGLNIEQFKDIASNMDVIKLSLSDAGLNFGTKGWINQTGITEVEEKPDKQIGLGETQTYEFDVFVEEGFEPPISTKPEFNLTIAVTADGVEHIKNEKIHMMNLDYQRQKAEAQKEKRESQSNISKAKSELQKLCNGNYLTLGVDLQYYLSNTQMEYIEKYLYCWIAQVNNSQTYENRLAELENNLKKEINNKIMQKLGINPNVGFFWSQTEAFTQVKVQTVYGEKTIEFTLHCGSLNSNGNTYASFGDIKYEILEKDNIPKNIPTEGLLGMTTYVGMNTFIQCMQDVAEDSIKKVYSELWGNNANIVAGMIVDETIMSIIDEKYGSFSNGVYTLFTKPSKNFVKKMRVDCPVDVYIYDLEGNLCGSVTDNKVDESYTDILMYVDGDSKIFYLTGDDYSLKLVGNDTGTMDYTVEELDENMDILRTVQFTGLPLSEGKEYKGFIYEPILIDSTLYSLTTDEGIIKPDKDTYDGNVNDRIFTEGIVIDTVERTIKVSEELKLNAYVIPENATNKKITWMSSNEQIATVNNEGLVIGIGKGDVIISAISDDGKFEAKYNLTVGGDSAGYTITASAEEGGSITPNGSVHVNEGENQTFTITPDSGYRLKTIVVDGKEEAADEEKTRDSSAQQGNIRHYTFSDVRVNHIIRVVFETDNGNTGDGGNTGGNTGDSGNTGDNTGGNGNSGNTGGNTGDGGNSGNTGGSTGDSGSGGNTGGNGSSSGNNGNTNSSGSNAGDNGSADSNSNNADGSGNTNAADNANNSYFLNSGAGNTTNDGNSTGNNNSNNKNNGVSNVSSGNNGINPKTDSSKDTEPRTEDVSHIEIYATIAMITGLLYLVLYFADEGGITEDEKNEIVAALVKWARQGSWVRKYAALVLIFFLLAYYHSIGKRTSVEWKTVYEK